MFESWPVLKTKEKSEVFCNGVYFLHKEIKSPTLTDLHQGQLTCADELVYSNYCIIGW